jgi:hypothetical protein
VSERDVQQFAIIEMNMAREVSRHLRDRDVAVSGRPGELEQKVNLRTS